jgi:hypothetical protein
MIEKDLEALPAIPLATNHDPRVGRPIRACLQHKLEVRERFVAHQVAAVTATRLVLLTHDAAVFHTPGCGVLLGFHGDV